jgi:phosphoglycolate phosphatase
MAEGTPNYTHLIWDFNGTILDDVGLGVSSVNSMLEARGLPVIPSVERYREIFDFPIRDYYRGLGFDFDAEDYEAVLAPEWVALYAGGEGDCPLYDGVRETVAAVTARGVTQLIVSASEQGQLRAQLAARGILDRFDAVYGLGDFLAKSKESIARAWREAHPEARPLLVGDTTHDAAVADAIGADCVLFCGGHQSETRLLACQKPIIRCIPELLNYL